MSKEVKEIRENSKIKSIIKGCIFTFIFTYLSVIIYSFILAYTNVSDSTIPTVIIGITMFSIFLSTMIFCRQIGTNGLINGAIISALYIGIIYLISSVAKTGFMVDKYSIIMIITCIIAGGIGGIIGVNFSSARR